MRTPNAAWKAICGICVFVLMFQVRATAQQANQDSRVDQLLGSNPSLRGRTKAELLQHPDPALLPALLKALPSSKGSNRDDILEILAKYDDPRKIPVFLAMLKSSSTWDSSFTAMDEQLSRLGSPAADAILADCTGEDPRWAAEVLSRIQATGAQYLLEAVQSDDSCKRNVGEQGLFDMFGGADRDEYDATTADIELACDAVIDPDVRIRGAARQWFASLKGKEENADFSGIVEVLIAAYQASAPPETMVKIADMLSHRERPRVTRFMRAAVHAPNPEIQRIAKEYLSAYVPKSETKPARAGSIPRTPAQKIAFLDELSNSPEGDVNPQIANFLKDPDADVRAAAASALGNVNAPSTDPRNYREIYPETATPALKDALKDPSPKVRAAAVQALGEMRPSDIEDDIEPLVASLKDPDTSVALSAAKAFDQLRSDSAVPVLTEIYRNDRTSAELKYQALWTLASICNPDSMPIFLEGLQTANVNLSPQIAGGLECALRKRPDSSAFQPILKVLRSQPLEASKWSLLKSLIPALGATKNAEALTPLADFLKASTHELRSYAADGLGLLGDPRAIPLLGAVLKDTHEDVRLSAVSALTNFKDFTAPPELIAALAYSDTVQWHAAKALVLSNDPKGIDALIAAMPTHPVAISFLGESRDPRVVPALIAFFENPANKTADRGFAAASLGKLGDIRAVDPLIASLNEDNFTITMGACGALGQLKDKRAIEPLKQAYSRWSTGQRQNALSVKGFIVQALLALGVKDAPVR